MLLVKVIDTRTHHGILPFGALVIVIDTCTHHGILPFGVLVKVIDTCTHHGILPLSLKLLTPAPTMASYLLEP